MEKLYQDALKTHYLEPIGLNRCITVSHCSEGYNVSCGDEISVFMQISQQNVIDDISFETDSCAICTASASLLCKITNGQNSRILRSYYHYLQATLNKHTNIPADVETTELDCLLPVATHPSRVNCALLSWQTAIAAIDSPVPTQKKIGSHA